VPLKDRYSIGVFDSGVGGLSVSRHVQAELPAENLIYFADQAHVPYGLRSQDEIQHYCVEITRFLLERGVKVIVIACNAASAAALSFVRSTFPSIPIVGMEPAVKPGAVGTRNGRIGVLATSLTFDSQRYARLMARYAQGVIAFEDPCRGLVEQIEAGHLGSPETERIVQEAITPMLAERVDTIVLGCTHYPFVMPLIRRLAGPEILVIDPAPAVARQVRQVMEQNDLVEEKTTEGKLKAFTSESPERLAVTAGELLGHPIPVFAVSWRDNEIFIGS